MDSIKAGLIKAIDTKVAEVMKENEKLRTALITVEAFFDLNPDVANQFPDLVRLVREATNK